MAFAGATNKAADKLAQQIEAGKNNGRDCQCRKTSNESLTEVVNRIPESLETDMHNVSSDAFVAARVCEWAAVKHNVLRPQALHPHPFYPQNHSIRAAAYHCK